MPIEHHYEKVTRKRERPPHNYEIMLADGTTIGLPGDASSDYNHIELGDRILIDMECERIPQAAMVHVFRDIHHVWTFGVNRDYISLAERK